MREERRARRRASLWQDNLYLLTGLLIGLGLGLLYTWVLSPVEYVDTTPASLRADFKGQYRGVIASAYLATGNLTRAQSRLALLGDADPIQTLILQSQQALAETDPTSSAYALAFLADALQQSGIIPPANFTSKNASPSATDTELPASPTSTTTETATHASPTPALSEMTPLHTPTPSATLPATMTPRPTRTPTPTQGASFTLVKLETLCNPGKAQGLLQVEIKNGSGEPIPGAKIIISWSGGENAFFTGFKPELGDGYADFQMSAGETYTLQLAAGSPPITRLAIPVCEDESGAYGGSLKLTFQQP